MDRERERIQKRGYGDTEGKINSIFVLCELNRERREEEEEGSREESLLNEMALPFPTVSSWDPYCLGRSCSFSITKIGWGHGRG